MLSNVCDPLEDRPAASRPVGTTRGPGVVPSLRPGALADTDALVSMHARCSGATLYRRFHAPMPGLSPRMARALLAPAGGASLLLTVGDDVVGAAAFSPDTGSEEPAAAEVGLLVEDAWQRRGHGARLLRAVAEAAGRAGFDTLTCVVLPDDTAVLRTVGRAGLRAHVRYVDGAVHYRVPVDVLRGRAEQRRGSRPAMGGLTTGLVSLLHERAELRAVHPAADLLDQAVRGGA